MERRETLQTGVDHCEEGKQWLIRKENLGVIATGKVEIDQKNCLICVLFLREMK